MTGQEQAAVERVMAAAEVFAEVVATEHKVLTGNTYDLRHPVAVRWVFFAIVQRTVQAWGCRTLAHNPAIQADEQARWGAAAQAYPQKVLELLREDYSTLNMITLARKAFRWHGG